MSALFALDDVTVTRGTGESHSHPLTHVSVEVLEGRCTVVIGPSGAGKSTLLRLLNRFEAPTHGSIRFRGRPIEEYDVLALRRAVGLVQQAPVLLGDTVLDDLRVAVPALSEPDALHLLDQVGLGAGFLTRRVESLSGGEGQRVCLARALSLEPEVLLLDEPTSALDAFAAHAVEQVIGRLAAKGLTTVLVSHDLRQARRLADDVAVVVAGTVADSGTAERVFEEPASEPARAFLGGVS